MEDLSDDVIHGLSDSLTLVGLFGKKQSIIAETTKALACASIDAIK
jgi:hypothetical protein